MARPASPSGGTRKGGRGARATAEGPRTRGGWTPAGTAAERRAVHAERGTARGERTRRRIMEAARRVFERDGYLDVGVADIAREAGVAHGSFYTYFSSKLEVFNVVCAEVSEVVDQAVGRRVDGEDGLDPVDALCRANLRYFDVYRENARIYALREQLAHIGEDLHATSVRRRNQTIDRVGHLIRRWQDRGVADPRVDPIPTAAALISMISNVAYWLFVAGDEEGRLDIGGAAATVNDIWIRAVDLRRTPNPEWMEGAAGG
ncbi:TetR/AcrR family transcriptional regulator [Actinomadura rugatobispora]|uniref:TetR/AcrR family transcriptional regulator n=1 Tax=Actinomadura rugatobispora TaxID=1994 RepID=A0ABW0ZZJ6_9ACTN|nr:hypothetical protein GCM10010200_110240 [Actinomadura rugatobispora]